MIKELLTLKSKNTPKINLSLINKVKLDPQIKKLIKKSCEAVLIEEKYVSNVEISVILTDNKEIQILNKDFRGKDIDTDVLSFPMNEKNPDTGYIVLGDIVISVEKAEKQALDSNHSTEREIAFLTVHSMLHLLGYDHENDPESDKIMREKQTRLLDGIGYTV